MNLDDLPSLSDIYGECEKVDTKKKKIEEDKVEETYDIVRVKKTVNRHECRRILSEKNLETQLPWHFEGGVSYHCISFGDVDSLTYLRVIAKQQKIKYALLSTWCMANEDLKEIERWLEQGTLGRIDFYVGEIFKASYINVYEQMKRICHQYGCRMAIFRNHSKVMVALGERFDAVIESSANVNTNPRTEQACITVDSDLAHFYKDFFDGINSFEREFDYIPIWQE